MAVSSKRRFYKKGGKGAIACAKVHENMGLFRVGDRLI